MEIKKGETYQIKGNSEYFRDKYGVSNPFIVIEGTDREIFGGSWMNQNGNFACMLYAMRSTGVPISGQVYYGKVEGLGECVHESELKEVSVQ